MSLSSIIMAIGGVVFIYALFKKIDWIAILLFTSIVADINFDLPGMPLNFRAVTTLCLLLKVLAEKKDPDNPFPSFISLSYCWHITFFIVYVWLISAKNSLMNMDLFKEMTLALISAFLGYYFYFRKGSYEIFKISITLGGLVCFGDLAYTYAFCGGFPVQRFYHLIVGGFELNNHNFFGYICGGVFVFLLADYLNAEGKTKMNLLMMPVMFLGTLLSTSRSSLLLVFIFALVMVIRALMSQNKGKKAYTLVVMTIACLFITLFIFQIVGSMLGSDSGFITTITGRLIDEPMAMINRALGNSYNENSLDSMEWRKEASSIAYDSFKGLIPEEQLFGIGYNGFLTRDYGHGYDAHNGVLLMMIEFGVFGFLVYMALLIGLIIKSAKLKLHSPFSVLLIYMILYITSHNKELTAFFAFLVTGTLAAQIQYRLEGRQAKEFTQIEIAPQ
ncbi:MAG: O-antigen ligase family protein [Chitinophagaceae bacterium]